MIQSFSRPERIYIGSAVNMTRRFRDHINQLRRNAHHNSKLQNHFNKYGEKDLNFIPLIGCTLEDLLQNEQYYIDSHKTYFNICPIAGNTSGRKASAETLKKLSISHKGLNTWLKGTKRSQEAIKKSALAITGRKRSAEFKENRTGEKNPMYGKPKTEFTIKRIKETNSKKIINTLTGEIFNSMIEAAKSVPMHISSFRKRFQENYKYKNIFQYYKPNNLNDMSKSAPTLENPCKKWIDFKADEGKFYYFDKSIGEKGKNIEVPTPIYFSVLDELSLITGFNKRHDSGIISNEVSSVVKEKLRVRTFKGGESVVGFYSDVKDSIIAMGGKFTKSVYALLIKDDSSTEFVNFKFKGAAFSAWLDKGFNPMNFIVGVSEFVEEKNGNNTYMVPVFKPFKSNPEIDAAAIEQDKILQEYLKVYKAQIPEAEVTKAAAVEESPQMSEKGFEASGEWKGGGSKSNLPPTKEELIQELKQVANPTGKQPMQSITNPAELTKLSRGKDNTADFDDRELGDPSDLPF